MGILKVRTLSPISSTTFNTCPRMLKKQDKTRVRSTLKTLHENTDRAKTGKCLLCQTTFYLHEAIADSSQYDVKQREDNSCIDSRILISLD